MKLTSINTTANRTRDAELVYGERFIVLEFHRGKVSFKMNPKDRDNNRDAVVDIEQSLHEFIYEPINARTLNKINDKILPIIESMKTANFSVRF